MLNKLKTIILIFILQLISNNIFAQHGPVILYGIVTNKTSKKVITGANIFSNKVFKAKSDVNGNFKLILNRNNKVKSSKVVLITALLISGLTVLPNTNLGLSPEATETEKTIKDYFRFPQIVTPVNESQKVDVLFTTNLLGQVDFVLAKTINETLKSEIEKQFLKLNLTKLKSDVVHSVTLNIKTL